MRVIVGGVYRSTVEGDTVRINRSMSDPVPTCMLNLADNNSSISIQAPQELLILDDQVTPNPAVNLLLNPSLNPYTTNWTVFGAPAGVTYTQNPGGGLQIASSNAGAGNLTNIQQATAIGAIQAGQTYTLSFYGQGSSSPTNVRITASIVWYNQTLNNNLGVVTFTGNNPPSTTLTRYSISGVAPAGCQAAIIQFAMNYTSGTNSGTVTLTQIQFEPDWIPTLSYPTPWVGPNQTNCQQLPLGYWIRQYRKFAGFVTHIAQGDYRGNVRTINVSAAGYAWLAGTILGNDSFSSKTDAQIISTLLSTYFVSAGTAMCTTTNVITGVTLSSLQLNWDDLRTIFDGLCSQSGFYWTISYYWDFIYAPPGYFSMPISLLCDNSGTPNNSTTYPAYNFLAETDFSQPGSTILVLGNGSNTAKVIDGSQSAQLGIICGYTLPSGASWMRKVNDATLNAVSDCTQRGIAEIIQYDSPRSLYHLTTNVELLAGYGVRVTSSTDGLNQTTLLLQQVASSWIGTSETLTDFWEYRADLGSVNRAVTNIISRLSRSANSNTAATAISTTTLVALEQIGIIDTTATGTIVTGYAQVILADGPVAYYQLNEITGTIADDSSGNAYQGTLHGGVTLGTAGLLLTSSNTAMTFNGSTGYISLPTTFTPTGAHAWSLECWCNAAGLPSSPNYTTLVAMGTANTHQKASLLVHNNTGTINFVLSTFSGDITSSTTVSTSTTYYVAGTYDGTNTRLYVNGQLVAGPTSFTLNLAASFASIGAENTSPADFFNGILDEPAFYTTTLSTAQVATHYAAGTSLYALLIMQDSPFAYYRNGEASGTTVVDFIGGTNNGTYNGSGVTLGVTGAVVGDPNTAVQLDGSIGSFTLGTGVAMGGWTAFTVELWFKLLTNSQPALASYPQLIGNDFPSGSKHGFFWYIAPPSDGASGYFELGNGTTSTVFAWGSGVLSTGSWYHLVATYDGANIKIYQNGTQIASQSFAGSVGTPGNPITISRFSGGTGGYINGVFDEIAIYRNTALSAAAVAAHYAQGLI